MRRKSGLGKGLDALIPQRESKTPSSGILEVKVDLINPNPHQPRTKLDAEELSELADSIQEYGIIQPLIVSRDPNDDRYVLIAGERRLIAAKQAGLDKVPVILREVSDRERVEMALIENLQRADLTPLETADAYKQLLNDYDLSHAQIASRVGKSRSAITNTLRLLNLSDNSKQALAEGKISEGHARAILALPTTQSQNGALQTILSKGLNVRQAEEYVRKLSGEKPKMKPKPQTPPEIVELEERLRTHLGTKVRLKHGRKGGTVTIYYYSEEELEAILDYLLND